MIALEALSKRYGNVQALHPLTTEFPAGVFGLLGPNGAGKTTLLRLLATALAPSDGTARIFGHDLLRERKAIRRLLGYLPQDYRAYPSFNALDYLRYAAWLKEMPPARAEQRIREVLEWMGLTAVARRRTSTYSGGTLRRLGIAQALLNAPRFLIVDEPTAGLDLEERLNFRNFLAQLPPTQITLLATHLVEDVEAICDHLAVLDRGRLLFSGTKRDLIAPLRGETFEVRCAATERVDEGADVHVLTVNRQGPEQRVRLRCKRPEALPFPAQAVEPTVQDAYLALIHDARVKTAVA